MTQTPIHLPAFVNYKCRTCGWCCKQYNITFSSDEYPRRQTPPFPAQTIQEGDQRVIE